MDDVISPFHPVSSYLLETFVYPIVFVYGAVVGSFLNVLIYRLPLILFERDEIAQSTDPLIRNRKPSRTISGKSYCPRCQNELKPYHNVPLFGFLFLGGRCAFCKQRISWRYFTVELLTACLWTAVYHVVQPRNPVAWCDFVFQVLFVSVLVALIFIDLDHFIAPDELNVAAFVLGIGRDLACLALAFLYLREPGGEFFFKENTARYLAAPWIPNAIVGALTYAAVLFAVSIGSHLYYTREGWESVGDCLKRYFTGDPPAEPPADYPLPDPEPASEDTEGEEEEPARLQFSPGLLSLLSALLLVPSIWWWSAIFFVIPMGAFFALTRIPGEPFGATFRRFFSADDQAGLPDDARPLPTEPRAPAGASPIVSGSVSGSVSPSGTVALAGDVVTAPDRDVRTIEEQLQAEANQFALEAQSGQHGGMGMGDVKLAFGIGALLGAGLALLSLIFAAFLGAVVGIALAQRQGKNLRVAVPFVPFMAAGAIITLLFGAPLVSWYLNLSGLGKEPANLPASRVDAGRPPSRVAPVFPGRP